MLIIDNAVSGEVAARAAVCTTLSGAMGGLTCLVNAWWHNKVGYSLGMLPISIGRACNAPQKSWILSNSRWPPPKRTHP